MRDAYCVVKAKPWWNQYSPGLFDWLEVEIKIGSIFED
jgi:hypothetical protein